jgi:LysM repeat protein
VRKRAAFAIGLVLFISGCSLMATQAPSPTSTRLPTGFLSPYHTQTAQPATPTATFEVTIPVTPSPTPTPFLHIITNDDTMLGLALRYGVKLEDLKAANPGVNPNAMSVGSKLVIPINGIVVESVPTPTAMPVHASQPVCIETGDGSTWCIVAIRNVTESSLENLSAWIGLYYPQGENIVSQVAYAPLDILKPGETMPLMAYFPAPLPVEIGRASCRERV